MKDGKCLMRRVRNKKTRAPGCSSVNKVAPVDIEDVSADMRRAIAVVRSVRVQHSRCS